MSSPPITTSDTPTTSSSTPSDSAATPTDIPRRSCSTCRRRMSTLDNHTICASCRETNCDRDHRCVECKEWTDDQIDEYVKNRKSLDSKSKKKSDSKTKSSSKSSAESTLRDNDTGLRDMEARLQGNLESNIKTMFADLTKQLLSSIKPSQDTNNDCLSAPSQVPEEGSKVESAGGWVGHDETKKRVLVPHPSPPARCLRAPWTPPSQNLIMYVSLDVLS